MPFAGINEIAVVVAAIASFAFGSAYYMAVGKRWMAALGKTEAEFRAKGRKVPVVPMAIALVAQLVMAYMLSGVMGHLGAEHIDAWGGVIAGFFVWGGFVVTTMAVNLAFQGARPALWVIDSAHWLGVLAIQGLIIGLFGV